MNIDLKRLPSESKVIRVVIYDKVANVNSATTYKLNRIRLHDNLQETVLVIDPNTPTSNVIIHTIVDDIIIEVLDNSSSYGSQFLYQTDRLDGIGAVEDSTPVINISTLPDKVQNFRMVDELSVFDYAGIPSSVNLSWDYYNCISDNFDVIGFHIYYSIADRNKSNWSTWEKLRGTTTDSNSTAAINFIDRADTSINIYVPQLADMSSPKDIKFSIVAITGGVSPLQSRFSRIETVSLKNKMVATVTPGNLTTLEISQGLLEDMGNAILSLPLKISFREDSFTKPTTVLIERLPYDPGITNFDFKYTYEIRTTNPFNKYATVSMYTNIPSDAKYEVRTEQNGKWITIPCTYDKDLKKTSFILTTACKFTLLIKSASLTTVITKSPESLFNEYTDNIINRLPTWFKIRRDPSKSNGAYFLEVIGLEFEEMKLILDYAEKQTHIGSASLDQVDILYKAKIPYDISQEHNIAVSSSGYYLAKADSLDDFLQSFYNVNTPTIFYDNKYVVDYDDNIIYTKKPFENLEMALFEADASVPFFTSKLTQDLHHVWNFFDEFGLLLNTPRLFGETNAEYKLRILDVFKNQSNASREGLMNGIARELGIRKTFTWKDTGLDLIIKDPMVIYNMIKINGKIVPLRNIYFTSEDYIVIKGNIGIYPENSEVTYISGLEMHTFTNKEDTVFKNQLYNLNGTATDLFKYYADIVKQRVPVEWGHFKWNEGFWDANSAFIGGTGYIPTIIDANITGFRPQLIALVAQTKNIYIGLNGGVQIDYKANVPVPELIGLVVQVKNLYMKATDTVQVQSFSPPKMDPIFIDLIMKKKNYIGEKDVVQVNII